MKITSAVFIKGIIGSDEILSNGKFQVAFLGRSNVGKSSLINSLTSQKHLARSSSNPGKTIQMDFFLINNSFYFIDFPGYGYAKHSFEKRKQLEKMLLWYLMCEEFHNRLLVLVIDAKVGISQYDKDILKIFHDYRINYLIAANKIDKLKMGQKEKQILKLKQENPLSTIIPYSSKQKNIGTDLLNKISSFIV
jgi:GTP-binding protein